MAFRRSMGASRRHVWIYDEDWEFLQSLYGAGGKTEVGTSKMIRNIIQIFVKRKREEMNKALSTTKGTP